MNRYVIYSPPYVHHSGGIRVLYRLCQELSDRGHNAYIYGHRCDYDERLCIEFTKEITDETIVIYPEITKGNPLNAKKVVRYVLYYPGKIGGDTIYDKDELVFYYSSHYLPSILNGVRGKLFIPLAETTIFKDLGRERTKTCFWVGKGVHLGRPDLSLLPEGCIEITRAFPANGAIGLNELFNDCSAFYCYDPTTSLMHEAPLAGCPTVLLANNWDSHMGAELGVRGCCNKEEDLEKARASTGEVAIRYKELEETLKLQLDKFIEVTS